MNKNTEVKELTLGQRIRAQRIRLGMTQEVLAEKMCVKKSLISAYENDKVDIKSSVIKELSEHLGTSPNYLLGFGEDPYLEEMKELLRNIRDEKIREVFIRQIRALVCE